MMSPRFDAAFDGLRAVACPILVLDTNRIVWANPAAAALTGYTPLDLVARSYSDLLAPQWRGQDGEQSPSGERELVTAAGELIWVEVAIQPTKIDGEALDIATVTDIRSRKHLEKQLNHPRNAYRRAIEANLDGFYLLQSQYDESGEITDFVFADVNPPGELLIPVPKDELIGSRVSEVFPHERGRRFLEQYITVARTGQALDEDFELTRVNGERHWFHHQAISVEDGIAVFVRDVSDRKASEAALHESEHRYRALFDQANDFVTLIGLDGRYLLVNQHFASAVGYRVDEIAGRSIHEFMPEGEFEASEQMRLAIIAGQDVPLYDRALRRRDGTEFLCEVNVGLVRDAAGDPLYIQSILRDVTWRRKTEAALRESEARYRVISESISDYAYAFRIDPEGAPVREWVTESFTRISGYTAAEIDAQETNALFHPDDRAKVEADVARVLQGEVISGDYRIVTKGGETRWLHILRQPIWDVEHQRVIRVVGVAQDITERKQAEEELRASEEKYRLIAENASDIGQRKDLEAILSEQERLRFELQKEQELNEIKSNLMRTISHEFRTPLALIVTATDLVDKYGDRLDAESRSERFQAIRVQVKRLSDMLDDISFVVQGTLHHMTARPSRINLEAYCREIVDDIQTSIGRTHEFVFTTDGQLAEGIADKALIVRIMGNLLSNAVKYSPEDSTITVMLYQRDADAILEVSDQGIGIKPEELKHIFEPFYRGNSVIDTVGGTGLGLGIVKECVDLHGGTITVNSAPGEGTTFVVRLPQTIA